MGSLRLFLALSVVIQHMGNPLGIRLLDAGVAVYLFFLISGFYMALVLNTKYVGPGSVPIFYLNRFVRIWPVYFVSVLISLWAGWWGILAGRMEGLASYWKAFIVFSNFTLIGLDSFLHIGLSPEGISFAPSGLSAATGMKFVITFPP